LWAGVDSARKREKLKARKMLKKRAESHKSAARFVGQVLQDGFELAYFSLNAN